MKMTVGPLPSGVYWRRRAIVGGVVLVVALLLWASCGNDAGDKETAAGASGAPTTESPDPTTTLLVPTTSEPGSGSGSPSGASSSSVAAPPPPSVSSSLPACADADLALTAESEQPVQFRGAYLKFTIKIKNVSAHECARDLGPDYQELYLLTGNSSGATKMWSSDACDAPHGSQLTALKPGFEVSYNNIWNGKATSNGCANRETPPAGTYQLVGRLDNKLSEPVTVRLT